MIWVLFNRDKKPKNIFLTASVWMKLADFGLAVRMSNGVDVAAARTT